jgi:hypothetical protein
MQGFQDDECRSLAQQAKLRDHGVQMRHVGNGDLEHPAVITRHVKSIHPTLVIGAPHPHHGAQAIAQGVKILFSFALVFEA